LFPDEDGTLNMMAWLARPKNEQDVVVVDIDQSKEAVINEAATKVKNALHL
jgi:gluconate kinase